jgi:hypothetical protein
MNLEYTSVAGSTISKVQDYALCLRSLLKNSGPISSAAHIQTHSRCIALPSAPPAAATAFGFRRSFMYFLGPIRNPHQGRELSATLVLNEFGTESAFVPGVGGALAVSGGSETRFQTWEMQEGRYSPHVRSPASEFQDWKRTLTPTFGKKALKREKEREGEKSGDDQG